MKKKGHINKTQLGILTAVEKGYKATLKGEIISPNGKVLKLIGKRYLTFGVRVPGINQPVKVPVHKFVAYMMYGVESFYPHIVVRHGDNNNTFNNSFENLTLGTQSDNMMDKPEEVRKQASAHALSFKKKKKLKYKAAFV